MVIPLDYNDKMVSEKQKDIICKFASLSGEQLLDFVREDHDLSFITLNMLVNTLIYHSYFDFKVKINPVDISIKTLKYQDGTKIEFTDHFISGVRYKDEGIFFINDFRSHPNPDNSQVNNKPFTDRDAMKFIGDVHEYFDIDYCFHRFMRIAFDQKLNSKDPFYEDAKYCYVGGIADMIAETFPHVVAKKHKTVIKMILNTLIDADKFLGNVALSHYNTDDIDEKDVDDLLDRTKYVHQCIEDIIKDL